jgi:hypothetical protein
MFPAIELNGVPLWGFTYRVIAEWLGLHGDPASGEPAGFQAAGRLLDFLLARGMELRYGWRERSSGSHPARIAGVKGAIPVDAVLAHLALPGNQIPKVNSLEIHPDAIRVLGLAMEEYVIEAEWL